MTLQDEIKKAKKEIVSDGYDMSVGEIISLYKDEEIIINPDFQRLFRWKEEQKTKFIESLLLGIPIPPIFVFQNEDGIWELIDGLQRLSTIFEFVGILRLAEEKTASPISLEGTRFLPSLAGKYWDSTSDQEDNGIGKANQFQIRRARIRVEILKSESDPFAKYELFQRLNTGGTKLSEQEVRNCITVMLNKGFYEWLRDCASDPGFITTVSQTERAAKRQMLMELALRFFIFRNIPYNGKLNVRDYLDNALVKIATDPSFSKKDEGSIFYRTFALFDRSLGEKAFKLWDGSDFKGKSLMSLFEVMAIGVSKNIDQIEQMTQDEQDEFIREKSKALLDNKTFQKYKTNVSGSARLAHLLPIAEAFLKP
ncbi:DUF262 domain-containing protein [Desulfonema magnum]|uniref:DUF262 n=1 Tax=Desulfonema magnum TaxID=45655 RepID=A0A975BRJ7_9BACT|nr:DUF262 domain-containing protein [Desulfonema magnum]QTA90293.1 DUF262 [Desulfonema magnum]